MVICVQAPRTYMLVKGCARVKLHMSCSRKVSVSQPMDFPYSWRTLLRLRTHGFVRPPQPRSLGV
jgi:hypothetical protein